jgi:hypothetical protein
MLASRLHAAPILTALVPLALLAVPASAQEAAAAEAATTETDALAADEPPAREAATEAEAASDETVIETPVPLAPVDAWREDPTVVFSAVDVDLDDFLWVARPVVVFADTEADPAFQQQIGFLVSRMDALAARDVVVLTDTDPGAMSDIRRQLRPRGFMMAILGKDGGVKLRKPFPWDVREVTRSIDKFPLRQQEIRDRANPNL